LDATEFFRGTRRHQARYSEKPPEPARSAVSPSAMSLTVDSLPPWPGPNSSSAVRLGATRWSRKPRFATGANSCTYTIHIQVLDATARRRFQFFADFPTY